MIFIIIFLVVCQVLRESSEEQCFPKLYKSVQSLFKALHEVHQKDMLHNDIKRDNLLFTADGQCKLSDFGLATPLSALDKLARDGKLCQTDKLQLDRSARGCGTAGYRPPEAHFLVPPHRRMRPVGAQLIVFSLIL